MIEHVPRECNSFVADTVFRWRSDSSAQTLVAEACRTWAGYWVDLVSHDCGGSSVWRQ